MTDKLLLQGGCVLTLGTKTPNRAVADVLIEDGRVAEVGAGLRARDAEVIDGTGTIVMPGFVDTHRHAWTSLFRNLGESASVDGGPVSAAAFRDHLAPDDLYAATSIGMLGALEAGITTVVDHVDVSLDDAGLEAVVQAHADAGVRTVLVLAGAGRTPARLANLRASAPPSTTIALGADGTDDGGAWTTARELGLRIFAHAHGDAPTPGSLAGSGLVGDDVTLVHWTALGDADLDAIASSGTSVSLAPSSEMANGRGSPPVQQLMDRDVRPGLGVDQEIVAPGDMFAQMRATISLQHAVVFDRKLAGKAGLPRLMTTRDVIRYATVEGARVAGLRGLTGSIEPGMSADIVMLRTDRPNVFPVNDPIGAVVWGMDTSNVDQVLVAGRVLVRSGRLETDVAHVRALAEAARDRVAASAGLVQVSTGGAAR